MALAPEDVIKKSFQPTHLRRGYDETQVDDFLDEVVVELRRLAADNDELRTQLTDCLDGQSETTPTGQAPADNIDAAEAEQMRRQREELVAELEELRAQAEGKRTPSSDTAPDQPQDAARIISLAQRLHEEHVQEGQATKTRLTQEAESYRDTVVAEADERAAGLVSSGQAKHDELVSTGQAQHDELVSTGQEQHDELVSTAQARHEELVAQAQEQRATVLADLSTRESTLQSTIEDLKSFESDYRSNLRELLQEQLDILNRDGEEIPPGAPHDQG